MATKAPPLLLLLTLLLITTPSTSHSLPLTQFQTVFSLAHSLMIRVANLRASRGDLAGSERAKVIADNLDRVNGLGFWGTMGSMGWNYVTNYARGDVASFDLSEAVTDMNGLLRSLNELTQMESESEKAAWFGGNYKGVLGASNSLFQRLLKACHESGALREMVEIVQKEVLEGDLLRDCLELGSNDLKGLIQVFRDIALQFSSTSDSDSDSDSDWSEWFRDTSIM